MCNMVSRKTRTKTRKPKFLSLRLEISPETTQQSGQMLNPPPTSTTAAPHHHPQLNLFPLHPENLVEDKETTTMAYLFDAAADGGATATMTALLGSSSEKSDDDSHQLPPSLTYACGGQDSKEGDLVRTALRSKERSDTCEEKWVCYEEVTSCAADLRCKVRTRRGLSLKLDYEEIMNAWTDKGPLFVHLESPQTVPDLLQDDFFGLDQYSSNGLNDGWGNNGGEGLWAVPEISISKGNIGNMKVKTEEVTLQGGGEEEEEWKQVRVREASVLRYKEKRQNRLFSKRIRYEVRKINAEKRPRIKGRFVKRS